MHYKRKMITPSSAAASMMLGLKCEEWPSSINKIGRTGGA